VKRHKEDSFALVAVNCHDSEDDYRAGQGELETDYASIFDGASIASAWGVNGFPTMFVLDTEGKIRFKDVRGAALDEAVQELLDELKEEPKK
jgi:predicted transcriptional regulator